MPGFQREPAARTWALFCGLCLVVLGAAPTLNARAKAAALGPQWGRYYVAAGLGEPGYADGAFGSAEFLAPGGLALSKDGSILYVADTGNKAVRRVWLGQDDHVDTLCGGPDSAAFLSPTALALSQDGSTLFVADAQRDLVYSVPSQGGAASPVPLDLSGTSGNLSGTALVCNPRNPGPNLVYVWNAPEGALYLLDAAKGRASLLGKLQDLVGVDGTLACTDQQLFLLRRDNGQLFRFRFNGQGLAGIANGTALAEERWGSFGPGVHGVIARMDDNQQYSLWIWDQDRAEFRVVNPDDGTVTDYPLRDYEANWLVPAEPFARTPFDDDPLPEATTRPLMKGSLAFVDDATHTQLYAAEADGNRVLGLGTPPWDQPRDDRADRGGTVDYRCGAKIPGVTRILLLGDSMVLSADPDAGDHYTVESGFGKQFERWVNLFSALQGKGRRFQVLQCSIALGAMGAGVTSFMINMPDELRALKPDEVVTLVTYMNMDAELSGMGDTRCPNDACWPYVDPAYAAQAPEDRTENYGPLHRSFLDWLKTAPDWVRQFNSANPDGTLNTPRGRFYVEPLQDPGFASWALKLQSKLDRLSAESARQHNITRYTQVLLPMRNQLAPGENVKGGISFVEKTQGAWVDDAIAKAATDAGIHFISLTQPLRLVEPTLFPLVGYNSHHYRTRGLAQAAMLAAWQYVQQLP